MTGSNRRSSAASFSMWRRYSSSVVAPISRSSPRARAGLSMVPASIGAPSALPAPTTWCSSSTNTISDGPAAVISRISPVSRSSNSPRYLVPATMPARSNATSRTSRSAAGTSPSAMRRAMPSTIAVLPTPGSPSSTGLFLVRRASTSMTWSISSSRPITGSSSPARASAVRSRPNRLRPCVPLAPGGGRRSPRSSEPRSPSKRPTSGPSGPNASPNGSSGMSPWCLFSARNVGLSGGAGRGPWRRR